MSKVTAYERNLVNAVIGNMRVTVIELGLWMDSMTMGRPKGMTRSHYSKAVDSCRIAANISEKLDNYNRWDLMSGVIDSVMTERHKSIIADIESRGFDFKGFLSDIVNCNVFDYY